MLGLIFIQQNRRMSFPILYKQSYAAIVATADVQ